MNRTFLLQIAYVANIVILVPVCASMFFGRGVTTVFDGAVGDSAGLRLLVGSLWAAILAASIAGLFASRFFAPVLLIQIVYKALWLSAFVVPLIATGKPWPVGISICFALIVIGYPFLFWYGFVRAS